MVAIQINNEINVVHAAHDLEMALAGFTVAEIQYALRDVLNVDMDAWALLCTIFKPDWAN